MNITFEDIKKANESIRTTDIKGKEYAEVNQRIKAFRMVFPNGRIITDIVSCENGIVTTQTTVCNEEGKVLATGLAQEKESSSFINKTSYIENCETSSVGRALGMCGFGIDTSVASYEEVKNAINNQHKEATPEQVKAIRKEMFAEEEKQLTEEEKAYLVKNFKLKDESEITDKMVEMLRKAQRERRKASKND